MVAAFAIWALAAALVAQEPPPAPLSRYEIPPAMLDDTLDVTGDTIDARAVKTRLSVPVLVNDRGPFRFVVDSGADRTVIGQGVAQLLALPAGPSVRLHGMAGESVASTVRVAGLRVGSAELYDLVTPVLAERDLGAQGLLGIDALVEQRLKLDFVAKTITIEDARRVEQTQGGDIVVVARRRRGQLILTQAHAGAIAVAAVIDTGSEVTIGNSALAARLFGRRKPPPDYPVTITSVTGQSIAAHRVILPELVIGGLTMNNVPIAFTDVPPFRLFGLDRQPAILLGTDVLELFKRVSLDFRRRKVRFVMRR